MPQPNGFLLLPVIGFSLLSIPVLVAAPTLQADLLPGNGHPA
jgi:hypothetical protein